MLFILLPELKRTGTWIALVLLIGFSLSACSGGGVMQPRKMTDDLKSDFELVSTVRVYFGHQSVGANIISGIEDLQSDLSETIIHVAELESLDKSVGRGVLLHTKVGENENPVSKCQDFKRILDKDVGDPVDVAMFKFCYIDFDETSDVGEIFAFYRKTMEELKLRYPNTIFIHVTAPLRYSAGGFGVWVREMLGRPNRSKLANVKRNEFNRRLRQTFAADPIFDLAASESTYPDGRRETFMMDGIRYYSLVRPYTDDGGHLNALGRTYAAADLVSSIARAVRDSGAGKAAEARHLYPQ